MSYLDGTSLDRAFVKPGTPMLSDVLDKIRGDAHLSQTRRRDLCSGLRRIAKALGRSPCDVPADAGWLRPRLSAVQPATVGLTPKSWTNAVSDAKSAMMHAGIITRPMNHKDDLSPAWRALWDAVLSSESPTLRAALCRFVYFLNGQGVYPEEVSNSHATAFLDAVTLNEISKNPDTSYRAAVNGWNLAARELETWPKQKLSLPTYQVRRMKPHPPPPMRSPLICSRTSGAVTT